MIKTVADFLEEFKNSMAKTLPRFEDIQHPGIFGSMYEGLSRSTLDRGLFEGLDLRVVKGKIRGQNGELSREIDCMVVVGDGESIPFTDYFIYPIEQVMLIMEVKKTLFGRELDDSIELFRDMWQRLDSKYDSSFGLLKETWAQMFGEHLPKSGEAHLLSFEKRHIYYSLVSGACLPVRVVFAYEGYADELSLRKGFMKYLAGINSMVVTERPRMNITSFPDLIICRDCSIVKLDGKPYSGPVRPDGYWIWLATRNRDPFNVLLEVFWTRLAAHFDLSDDIFGEDLEIEAFRSLCAAKAGQSDIGEGWMFDDLSDIDAELGEPPPDKRWEPHEITTVEQVVLARIGVEGLDLQSLEMQEFLAEENLTVEQIVESLRSKGLAAPLNERLCFLTKNCVTANLPDGRVVAADNHSGRLERWVKNFVAEFRAKSKQHGQ